MPWMLEPVAVPPPPKAHDSNCPFCSMGDPKKQGTLKSKIGEDNKAEKLEDDLAAKGKPRSKVGFKHDDYGRYSEEPHHLVSGNEALKGHPVEAWLATKAKDSKVNADTGFDVNSARNGVWLPSITDANRICKWETYKLKGKKKRRPAPSERKKKPSDMWSVLSMEEKDEISFAIMKQEELQFHKGNHRDKGETLEECYIREVKRILTEIRVYANAAVAFCEKAPKDKKGKYPPPLGVNEFIYAYASAHMLWHVSGPPESWFVFISTLSRRCFEDAIQSGEIPWDAPFPGHPNH